MRRERKGRERKAREETEGFCFILTDVEKFASIKRRKR
jgi:hypothetical protein